MVSFMREEREMMVTAMEKQRAEMQALLDQQAREMDQQARETERLREGTIAARVRGEMAAETQAKTEQERPERQLAALQARLQSLHASKLLADEELYTIEDAIADSVEAEGGADSSELVGKLVALSGRLGGDAALARQLRRKFV